MTNNDVDEATDFKNKGKLSESNVNNENKDDIFHWPPLESDPSIFTQYLHSIGLADDWEIGECYGLDEDCLGFIPASCVAMIVNAERLLPQKEEERQKGDETMGLTAEFYMKQSNTLDNACGIIACLHAIFNTSNNNDSEIQMVQPDSILDKFWDQVKDQTPQERCTTLETCNEFKNVHKSYAMQGQSQLATAQEQVNHHYTAFLIVVLPRGGGRCLVEFDGTKRGPLVVAENVESVVHATAAELQRRLRDGEISESLSVMTLVRRM